MLVRFSYFFMVFEISSLSWPFILILLPPPQCRVVVGAESLSEKRKKGNEFFYVVWIVWLLFLSLG